MASKPTDPYKQALYTGIASLIRDAGYGSVEPIAMESLVEMAHSFISQVGKSSKHYSELANRSQVEVSQFSIPSNFIVNSTDIIITVMFWLI